MHRFASDKTRLLAIAVAVSSLLIGGCASDGSGGGKSSKKSSASADGSESGARTRRNIADGEYYAEGWVNRGAGPDELLAPTPAEVAPRVRSSRGQPLAGNADPNPDDRSKQTTSALPEPAALGARANGPGDVPPLPSAVKAKTDAGYWTLVLATFTDGDTNAAAQRMISETQGIAPEVRNLGIHPTANGSMVVYGNYTSREDPKANEDRTWLKTFKHQGRQIFSRVSLVHLDLRPLQADLHPYDLHMARREHPKVNPLYTLEVAVWDDLDSGELTYEEIQRQAETYALQLRMSGYQGYFFHDDIAERSSVTVSLFDKTAINAISGLYSDAVTELIRRFPARMMNGEPMGELKDPFRPEAGIKPQSPVLVEVPDM